MRTSLITTVVMLLGAALIVAMNDPRPVEPVFTEDFGLEQVPMLLPNVASDYVPLRPGHQLRFEGVKDGARCVQESTVLRRIRPIVFNAKGRAKLALARIVEERDWINGELVEISRNYYAMCPKTGNVYNLGEDATFYENGRIVGHEGSWLAGKDGARPGLLMPNSFLLGARYCQGIAPGVYLDRAENIEMGLTVTTPAGTFTDCIKVAVSTPLEPDEECISIYAPGVGLIADEELLLVNYSR